MNTTSVAVTAGMGGFLVLFGLMVVVWLLGRDMTRRLRRMRLAEERRVEAVLRERAEQERARRGTDGAGSSARADDADGPGDAPERDPLA